jgi:hypothetical protein
MFGWWSNRGGRNSERAAQPELDAARRARAESEQAMEAGRSRWPIVHAIVSRSREIRQENHLAEDLRAIFRDGQL